MKKLLVLLSFLVLSVSSFAEGKVAVVNFELAVFNTDAVKAKMQALQNDPTYKKNIEEIQGIQEGAKALIERVKKEGPTMSASQKEQAQKDMDGKKSDMEYLAKKIKEAEAATLQPVMYQMQAQAMSAVKEIIASEGIGLLLNASAQSQNVIHADTSFDITPKLTAKLNTMNKKP